MSTLNSAAVHAAIERLYGDADRASGPRRRSGGGPGSERGAERGYGDGSGRDSGRGSGRGRGSADASRPDGDRPPHDSREFWTAARERHFAVSRETGRLLYLLAVSRRAKVIVEFGASFGVSTLHLAAGLRDNGGGRLITTEYEANKVAATRAVLAEAGLRDLVEVREGEAMETLAGELPTPIDMVFLDGAKNMYFDVLRLLTPHLAPAALVIADNADAGNAGAYRNYIRSDPGWVSAATADRVEISVRTG